MPASSAALSTTPFWPSGPINSRIFTVVSFVVQHLSLRRLPDQLLEGQVPGSLRTARTISHWVEAGRGTSRFPCRPSRRLNGRPAAVFQQDRSCCRLVASYFFSPASTGVGAVNTSTAQMATQFLQFHRPFAPSGGCPMIRTSTPGTFS